MMSMKPSSTRTCILINPPTPVGLMFESEHLGLAYLLACLCQEAWDVTLLDAYLEGLTISETLTRLSQETAPCFVGITVISRKAFLSTLSIIEWIQQTWPGTNIILGGYYATFWTTQVLEDAPEGVIVVRGEGEATLLQLSEHLFNHKDCSDVLGISFRQDNRIHHSPARPLIANLDNLPFPARPTLDLLLQKGGYPSVYSSRGCYFQCSFCQVCQFYRQQPGSVYRARSPSNILTEMLEVVKSSRQNNIGFVDDEFIGSGKKGIQRTLAFCDALEAAQTQVVFGIQCRADSIERDLFLRLKTVGLKHVYVGIESVSSRQLKLFNKNVVKDQNRRALEILDELNIEYNIGLILYDPYSQLEEIADTARFLRSIQGFPLGLNGLNILPGTPLYERVRNDGLLDTRDGDVDYRFVNPELTHFRKLVRAYASIYIPPINRMRKLSGILGTRVTRSQVLRSRLASCYQKVRELHILFLDEAVALLHKGYSSDGLLSTLNQEYARLGVELELLEASTEM
jgi:anaerobic magnesium-protoporphyrin IX monomethyl ester cyclase